MTPWPAYSGFLMIFLLCLVLTGWFTGGMAEAWFQAGVIIGLANSCSRRYGRQDQEAMYTARRRR